MYPIKIKTIPGNFKQLPKIVVGNWHDPHIIYWRNKDVKNENNFFLKFKILKANNINIQKCPSYSEKSGLKAAHQYIAKYLGPAFYRRLNAASYYAWIEQHKSIIDKYCFHTVHSRNFYHSIQIKRLWRHFNVANSAFNDEIHNIAPILIYFGSSPKRLKRQLGKELWKKICCNSSTTNKGLIDILDAFKTTREKNRLNSVRNFTVYKERLNLLSVNLTAGGIARLRFDVLINEIKPPKNNDLKNFLDVTRPYFWSNKYGQTSKYLNFKFHLDMYNDTQKMALDVERKFNHAWSKHRIQREHHENAKKIAVRNYSATTVQSFIKHQQPIKIIGEKYNCNAVLAMSEADVALEGFSMKHCIAAYANDVSSKDYIVISLEDLQSNQKSTLGLKYNKKRVLVIDQHYGKYNSNVESVNLKKVANAIVTHFNKN